MPNDSTSPPSPPASDPEIERLKERLSFYESFDQLIQRNVSQAGALLRETVDLRENAAADADHAKHQLEEQGTENRERYRALFSVMLDEITSLQGQAERLARRLTDAIDQLESELGPGTEFPSLPSHLTAELNFGAEIPEEGGEAAGEETLAVRLDDSLAAQQGNAVALGAGSAIDDPTLYEAIQDPDPAGQPASAANDLTVTEPAEQSGMDFGEDVEDAIDSQATPRVTQPASLTGLDDHAGQASDIDATSVDSPVGPVAAGISDRKNDNPESALAGAFVESQFILLVHGVPRAATALSLKRHLETLGHVLVVEPREFAAGVLRLQLRVSRDVTAHDMKDWPESSGFTAIHARPGLLEIQLDR